MSQIEGLVSAISALPHPLMVREIRPPRNWNEWRTCWQESTTTHQLTGLLHEGFNVGFERFSHGEQEYNHTDRLETYFAIADGWERGYSQWHLETDEGKGYLVGYDRYGNRQPGNPAWFRQKLARKAFDVLAQNFFKVEVENSFSVQHRSRDPWGTDFVSGRILPILMNFFAVEGGAVRNLSGLEASNHNEQQAINFLLRLAAFVFKWKGEEIKSWHIRPEEKAKQNAEMRKNINSAKLWMLEVLSSIGKIDLLWDVYGMRSSFWGFEELDEPCLSKLKEISLRTELRTTKSPVGKTRLATTVEEACLVNSKAAEFLKLYEIRKAEYARLAAIREAERQMEEAEQNLKRLATTPADK